MQPLSSTGSILEGSSAICAAQGQFLFPCSGERVYRAIGVHVIGNMLPNGKALRGGANSSSTQSPLFVPHPEDDSIDYLFTDGEAAGLVQNT